MGRSTDRYGHADELQASLLGYSLSTCGITESHRAIDAEFLAPGAWVKMWYNQFAAWLEPLLRVQAKQEKLLRGYLMVEEVFATLDRKA